MRPRTRISAPNVLYTGEPGVQIMSVPSYSPANAPGVAFWFNADDVSAATSVTWDSRVGSFRGTNQGSFARPFDTTFSSNKKGAVFNNNVYMDIKRTDGTAIYPGSSTPYPTNAWFATVLSVATPAITTLITTQNGNSVNMHARLGTTGSGSNWGIISSAGSGAAWNDVQLNASTISAVNWNNFNVHMLFVWQLGSSGTFRINGVEFNYDWNFGLKNHLPSGNVSDSNLIVGGAWNGVQRAVMNMRHLLHGTATLSLLDIQKLEGALAHDSGIQASLPLSHPYRTNKP